MRSSSALPGAEGRGVVVGLCAGSLVLPPVFRPPPPPVLPGRQRHEAPLDFKRQEEQEEKKEKRDASNTM